MIFKDKKNLNIPTTLSFSTHLLMYCDAKHVKYLQHNCALFQIPNNLLNFHTFTALHNYNSAIESFLMCCMTGQRYFCLKENCQSLISKNILKKILNGQIRWIQNNSIKPYKMFILNDTKRGL